jgi:acyl-CoA-binding protein
LETEFIYFFIFTGAPAGSDSLSNAKFNAWKALKGTSKDDAMKKYIARAQELQGKYA